MPYPAAAHLDRTRRVPCFTSSLILTSLALAALCALSVPARAQQGGTCITARPFCTGTTYTFPASTGTTAETGPSYDCLGSQPNPAWYYLKIKTSGNIVIDIAQTDAGGTGRDVDFICWGPFTSPTAPCTAQLTQPNVVDCSYSGGATETCTIPAAVVGEYYILLLTNFANVPATITFSQTGGTGATDCGIVTPTKYYVNKDIKNTTGVTAVYRYLPCDDPHVLGGRVGGQRSADVVRRQHRARCSRTRRFSNPRRSCQHPRGPNDQW
jgi:hypothetical protein